MITLTAIHENYKGYDLIAVDTYGYHWEELSKDEWFAIGEYGWHATDEDVETAGIDHVSVDEEEKTVYVYVNDSI